MHTPVLGADENNLKSPVMQLEFDLIVFILTKLIRSQVMKMSLNFADMLNNDTRGLFAGHAAHWGARKVFF